MKANKILINNYIVSTSLKKNPKFILFTYVKIKKKKKNASQW